ncbi:uncharacterized protein LOC108166216 [Poecilia reticulata]|uniref:uncharacterized protein LOC108166216 n=1 Tax=Poecilia reticulata TaxID=8081 RepID=UPI0007EA3033|nr:PREDICTED: uncharacterized protein LOC108166216 [Poecilia reticulata]
MEQSSNQADVESLQKSVGRRRSLVDFFLGMSVVVLFVAVTALAVGGMLVVKELRSELRDPGSIHARLVDSGSPSPSPAYKMHNFAYLEANESKLDNTTMSWRAVRYGERTEIGSNFQYDTLKRSLTPLKKGTYFMYIQVTINCTHKCEAGVLKLEVTGKLTCNVELTDDVEKTPVSKKCWTVTQLDNEDLITQMTVPKKIKENWSLDVNRSGLGVFLVD